MASNTKITSKKVSKLTFPERFEAFEQLSASYGLARPDQIKMKIIWKNVMALIVHAYSDEPQNKALLSSFDSQWKICEIEEQRFDELMKKASGLK